MADVTMTPVKMSTGIIGKLVARLRTPTALAATIERATPIFAAATASDSPAKTVVDGTGSRNLDADEVDEGDDDPPMPEFECDWLNDGVTNNQSTKDDVTTFDQGSLPPTVLSSMRAATSSASSVSVLAVTSAIAGVTKSSSTLIQDRVLSSSSTDTSTSVRTSPASHSSLISSSHISAVLRATGGSGSTSKGSYYSSSSNVGSASSGGSSGGVGSSSVTTVDSSGDRMLRNTVSILGRSVGQNGLTSKDGRLSESTNRSVESLHGAGHSPSEERDGNRSNELSSYASSSVTATTSRSIQHSCTTSADRILSSSQSVGPTKTDSITPGFPRAGLHAASSKRVGIASKWKTTVTSNGKPLRKAGRVMRSDQEATEDAESEGGNQTTSPDGHDQSLNAAESPPMMHARPPPSTLSLADSSSATSVSSTSAASASQSRTSAVPSDAMDPSAYIHRDATTRSRSAMGNLRSSTTSSTPADSSFASTSTSSPPVDGVPSSLSSSSHSSTAARNHSSSANGNFPSSSTSRSQQLVASPDVLLASTPPFSGNQTMCNQSQRIEELDTHRNRDVDSRTVIHTGNDKRLLPSSSTSYSVGASVSSPTSRQASFDLPRSSEDRESTILPNRGGVARSSSNSTYSRDAPSPVDTDIDRATVGGAMDRSTTMRQSNQSRPVDSQHSRAALERRQYEEFQDENQYDSRSAYAPPSSRQHHAPAPLSTPSYSASSAYQPHHPSSHQQPPVSGNGRAILGETYRASNLPSQPEQQQHSLRSSKSSAGGSYPNQMQQRDTQAPLRDRSPGAAEATPSQHSYYPHSHHQQPSAQSQNNNYSLQQQQYQPQQIQQQYASNQQQQYQQQQSLPLAPPPAKKKVTAPLYVNGTAYHRAGLLGKGGSSRVYRVLDSSNNLFAIKRVDIGRNDAETRASFLNEIQLLEKLKGKPEIIRLIDSEMNEQKKTLMMVMEVGETDLNGLLADHLGKRISMNFIRYIWEQMLEAVQVIHNENVVHTDLKPANFVLVKGHLKLIDFGISKAIANDTTNIGRDQQIGTANYMPPEALMDSGMGQGGKRLMKLGRASDVWSLGCILHQMVYGHTPFSHFKDVSRKILAIQNPLHVINFAPVACPLDERGEEMTELAVEVGEELRSDMKGCLRFDARERVGIIDLLKGGFLCGRGGSDEQANEARLPTIDDETMKLLVDRVTKSVTGKLLSSEDGKMMASKLMKELRDARPHR